jgi:hypothetical protein
MTKRHFLAAVLGAIVMFIWTSITHMVLPLGKAGIREMPNESAVLTALQTNLGENRGLYHFPGHGLGPNPTREQKSEAMKHMNEKLATNPSGLLMYYPPGRQVSLGRLLGTEFATEVLEAILVVFLLAQTGIGTFGGRVGFVFVAGILAAIATNVSYWNWYGFPGVYTASYMFIQVVGFLCVGLVAALVLAKKRSLTSDI